MAASQKGVAAAPLAIRPYSIPISAVMGNISGVCICRIREMTSRGAPQDDIDGSCRILLCASQTDSEAKVRADGYKAVMAGRLQLRSGHDEADIENHRCRPSDRPRH